MVFIFRLDQNCRRPSRIYPAILTRASPFLSQTAKIRNILKILPEAKIISTPHFFQLFMIEYEKILENASPNQFLTSGLALFQRNSRFSILYFSGPFVWCRCYKCPLKRARQIISQSKVMIQHKNRCLVYDEPQLELLCQNLRLKSPSSGMVQQWK